LFLKKKNQNIFQVLCGFRGTSSDGETIACGLKAGLKVGNSQKSLVTFYRSLRLT